MSNLLPMFLIFLPLLTAAPAFLLARRREASGHALAIAVTALCFLGAAAMLWRGDALSLTLPGAVGLGLTFRVDGFRAFYAAIACFMWTLTSMLAPAYLAHGEHKPRYLFFTLLTMGATVGVFLSNDLVTALVFFEIMSFTSYGWVAHEQTAARCGPGRPTWPSRCWAAWPC